MRRSTAFAAGFVFVGFLSASPRAALAQPASEIEECATAAEDSQSLKNAGKLAGAREKLLVCARPVCPSAVQRDCTRWLADIERVLPSVVLRVTDASGRDITRVRVKIDGALVAEKLDGRPIPVDPGEHAFTYEVEGQEPVTETLLIRQGEKDRLVSAMLGGSKDKDKDKDRDRDRDNDRDKDPPPPPVETSSGSIPPLTWVLGGVGVVAVGIGAALWASGTSDHSEMESGCAKTHSCAQSEVDSAKSKLLIGDIAMVGGVVALGAGVVLAVLAKSQPAAAKLDVKMVTGGGVATFGTRF